MTIHRHIERCSSVIFVEIEKDAHGCGLRISRHIENIPACALIGVRKLTQICGSVVTWDIVVERVVAEVTICKRSIEGYVVPRKRVLPLRDWEAISDTLVGIVVRIFEPDEASRGREIRIGDRCDFYECRRCCRNTGIGRVHIDLILRDLELDVVHLVRTARPDYAIEEGQIHIGADAADSDRVIHDIAADHDS